MKIVYGVFALAIIFIGGYLLITPTASEVVRNDPLPVPTVTLDREPESLTIPPTLTATADVPANTLPTEAETVESQDVVAQIVGTPSHPAEGSVRILRSETPLVRFENYQGTNGPDLYVYLTNNLKDVSSGVNLGRSKSTNGSINYTVPGDVSISDYRYIVTWCERFGVLFDYADINPE